MTKPIGPGFAGELAAAGLAGLPFSWSVDGEFHFAASVSQEQRDAVLAVYAAHDALDGPRRAKLAAAGVQYAAQLAAGVVHGGKVYQIDEASQQNIAAMGALAASVLSGVPGAAWLPGFAFVAADNEPVPMTPAQMFALAQAAAARVFALRLAFRLLKDAIMAADDQAALDAIDVSAGWPA